MADSTPPSDIPDPTSPNPATPSTGPAVGGGAKRIRSMPDRPAGTRPTGTIRSMPEAIRAGARSTSTYANALGTEKSWGRGLAMMWAIILVALLFEALNAAGFVLAGRPGWPLPIEAGRIALICTFFAALWAGLGWLRYVSALVNLGSSAWLFFLVVHSYKEAPRFWAQLQANQPTESVWTVYSTFETYVKVVLAITYLVAGLYLLFSDDVREFIAHRRTRGRVWSALLVTVFSYGCMVLIFAAQPLYGKWMEGQRAEMQRFGDGLLRTMASHWDPATFEPVIDREYGKSLTKEGRASTFANFKDLGTLTDSHPAPMKPVAPMPQYPLQDKVPLPDDLKTLPGFNGKGYTMSGIYKTTGATFEHGNVEFSFDLTRDLGGPWRMTKFNAENLQIDRPPKPAPDASPAPSPAAPGGPAAASPAPSAMPGPTASTMTTDAAAPTPPATASPARSPLSAPTPAASASPAASPAATPVPSTGG